MNKAWDLEYDTPTLVAKIVRRAEEVPGHVIMVTDLSPIILLRIEWSVFIFTYAAGCSSIVAHLLSSCKRFYRPCCFEELDTFLFPFYKLLE